MKNLGQQMGGYVLAGTAESSPDGMPKKPGSINGGFFAKTPDMPDHLPSVVIDVPDIRKAMAKVASAGGQVLGEPMAIPGIGDYVSIRDSEGNRVGMLQPLPMPKQKPAKKRPAAPKKQKKPTRKA